MEAYRRLTRLSLAGILLVAFTFGCQRSNQTVQAARENTTSNDRQANTNRLSEADKRFITEAEEDNIKERSLGRIVVEKSTNSDVKHYAQMLVDDHTEALRDLVELMQNAGMSQPSGLPAVKHEAQDRLNGLSEPAFDREYIDLMVRDHEKAVSKFRQEENTAQAESVRAYAKRVLPVLQKHLDRARELQGKLTNVPGSN